MGCRVIESDDYQRIAKILAHPSIAERITELTVSAEALPRRACSYLVIEADGKDIGACYFDHLSEITWDFHPSVIKEYRKEYATDAVELCIRYAFDHCKKLECSIPDCFQTVIAFARRMGFHIEGVSRKSYLWKSDIIDLYRLGMTDKEFLSFYEV